MSSIDIMGLDKAEVLSALFNASQQQGMSLLDASGQADMDVADARKILDSITDPNVYFDCLRGRVMKVDLSSDTLSPVLFDRDNGQGAAAAAIEELR